MTVAVFVRTRLISQSEHTIKESTVTVEGDETRGWFVASWGAPCGQGGITTQGRDLRELPNNVREAVLCHFGKSKPPPA